MRFWPPGRDVRALGLAVGLVALVAGLLASSWLGRSTRRTRGRLLEAAAELQARLSSARQEKTLYLCQTRASSANLVEAFMEGPPESLGTTIRGELASTRMDLALVTDVRGDVLLWVGPGALPVERTTQLPGVLAALSGGSRGDIWKVGGQLFEVGTAPVRSATGVLGTLSLGRRIGMPEAREVQEVMGVSTVLLLQGDPIGSSLDPVASHEAARFAQRAGEDPDARLGPEPTESKGQPVDALVVPLRDMHGRPTGRAYFHIDRTASSEEEAQLWRTLGALALLVFLLALGYLRFPLAPPPEEEPPEANNEHDNGVASQ